MSLPIDDDAITAWVTARLRVLDTTPRNPRWRTRALGQPVSVAIAQSSDHYTLTLDLPVGEMRLLNDAAKRRGIGTRSYAKRCIATMMAVDGFDPVAIPVLSRGGLLGP